MSDWAHWVARSNHSAITALCGTGYFGTPFTIMDRLWECGAVEEEDVTGYAQEIQSDNSIFHEIDRFMLALQRVMPNVYRALIARHLRIVSDTSRHRLTERIMAAMLYGLNARAHEQFRHDCNIGYISLQIRMINLAST